MPVYQQRVALELDYPVYFCRDVLAAHNPALAEAIARKEPERRHRCLFVVERKVDDLWPNLKSEVLGYVSTYASRLELVAPVVVIEGGENAKNDGGGPTRLLEVFHAHSLDRHAVVVAIGGGALLDLVGYAAATAHRGLRLVRIPTTVLSQNDSGVGVKNGINAFGKKNFIGTFAPPFAVLDDAHFLETLPRRERIAGMAEAVKVACIRDAAFFDWLEARAPELLDFNEPVVEEMIRRCAVLHLEHIATSGDPFELGTARPLDFGHWAAHKLEALSGFELRHGEAVAMGIALDTRYSALIGRLDTHSMERVVGVLRALDLPLWHDALALRDRRGRRAVLGGLAEFREHLGGELTVTLLEQIGRGCEVHELDEARIEQALTWLQAQAKPAC
jgi:3-dehydroquinate synthase